MFDFIYYNFSTIFVVAVFVIGAVAMIMDFTEFSQRRQRRSEAARRGWATRRMNREQ